MPLGAHCRTRILGAAFQRRVAGPDRIRRWRARARALRLTGAFRWMFPGTLDSLRSLRTGRQIGLSVQDPAPILVTGLIELAVGFLDPVERRVEEQQDIVVFEQDVPGPLEVVVPGGVFGEREIYRDGAVVDSGLGRIDDEV